MPLICPPSVRNLLVTLIWIVMLSCFSAVVKEEQHADGPLLGFCTLQHMVCASSVCPTAVYFI